MSNLSPFEPRLLESALSDRLESMFKRFMTPMMVELGNGVIDMRAAVTETDLACKVQAGLPCVKKDDINVQIDGNVIYIDAQARKAKETKVSAKYGDGALTLELPKKAGAVWRRIKIQ